MITAEYKSPKDFVNDYILENSDNQNSLNPDRLLTHATDIILNVVKHSLPQQSHKIALLAVDNYSFVLPKDFTKIDELSYQKIDNPISSPHKIIHHIYDELPLERKAIKCPTYCENCADCSQSYIEIDIIPRREFLQDFISHKGIYGAGNGSKYHNGFSLMLPNTSPYFNKNYHIPTCRNLHNNFEAPTYRIELPKVIVSFKKGFVLLSYWGLKLDEDDQPQIMAYPSVYNLVNTHLDEQLMRAEWRKTKSPDVYKMYIALQEEKRRALVVAKKDLEPWDMPSFWAEVSKYMHQRAGRPYDITLLK